MAKTIFILGAGASMPMGFPSGKKLVSEIIKELTATSFQGNNPILSQEHGLLKILIQNISYDDIQKFCKALKNSGATSIDTFLTKREEFREIGKMSITYILLKYEKRSLTNLFNLEVYNWYYHLWDSVNSDKRTKDFRIYTFNYDRSLEYFLATAAMNLENLDMAGTRLFMKQIPIIHLHGSIGTIPLLDDDEPVPYGKTKFGNFETLKNISERINIIYEASNNAFQELKDQFEYTKNIVFLGFGFNLDNMRRLGFLRNEFDTIPDRIPAIYATTYDMTENEINYKIKNYINKYLLALHGKGIKGYSKESFIYEDLSNLDFLRKHFNMNNLFL